MFKLLNIICIIYAFVSCTGDNYIEYRPHYLSKNGESKYYGEAELDSIQYKNTIQVFEVYAVDYKVKNGEVLLITEELSKDWNLLWNFTTKSNDTSWLRTHQP